jgi:hypothetical protein
LLLLFPLSQSHVFHLHLAHSIVANNFAFLVLFLLEEDFIITLDFQLLLESEVHECLLDLFSLLVLFLSTEEGSSVIQTTVNEVIEFVMALLVIVSKNVFVSCFRINPSSRRRSIIE